MRLRIAHLARRVVPESFSASASVVSSSGLQWRLDPSTQGLLAAQAEYAGLSFEPHQDTLFAIAERHDFDRPAPSRWYNRHPTLAGPQQQLVRNMDYTTWTRGWAHLAEPSFDWRVTGLRGLGTPRVRGGAQRASSRWAHLVRHSCIDYRVARSGTGDDFIRVSVMSNRGPCIELQRQAYAQLFRARAFARWMELDCQHDLQVRDLSSDGMRNYLAAAPWASTADGLRAIETELADARNLLDEHSPAIEVGRYLRHCARRLLVRSWSQASIAPEHLIERSGVRIAGLARKLLPRLDSAAKLAVMAGAHIDVLRCVTKQGRESPAGAGADLGLSGSGVGIDVLQPADLTGLVDHVFARPARLLMPLDWTTVMGNNQSSGSDVTDAADAANDASDKKPRDDTGQLEGEEGICDQDTMLL